MAEIRPLEFISKKWAKVAAGASDEYNQGVRNPRRSWSAGAKAAKEAYEAGIANAISRGARERGIEKAGDAKWSKRAVELGGRRFSEGVRVAENDFTKGFSEFHGVIKGTTLPPRGPKGAPENIERVRAIAQALHEAKIKG